MTEQRLAERVRRRLLSVDGQMILILRWRGYFVVALPDKRPLIESEQILLHKLHSLIFS
jgi:hypothetical protein